MRKKDINIFGEDSQSVCEKHFLFLYRIRRLCDNAILAIGFFKKYKDAFIRTMYTGEKHGTGDIVLYADFCDIRGIVRFYKFR